MRHNQALGGPGDKGPQGQTCERPPTWMTMKQDSQLCPLLAFCLFVMASLFGPSLSLCLFCVSLWTFY